MSCPHGSCITHMRLCSPCDPYCMQRKSWVEAGSKAKFWIGKNCCSYKCSYLHTCICIVGVGHSDFCCMRIIKLLEGPSFCLQYLLNTSNNGHLSILQQNMFAFNADG